MNKREKYEITGILSIFGFLGCGCYTVKELLELMALQKQKLASLNLEDLKKNLNQEVHLSSKISSVCSSRSQDFLISSLKDYALEEVDIIDSNWKRTIKSTQTNVTCSQKFQFFIENDLIKVVPDQYTEYNIREASDNLTDSILFSLRSFFELTSTMKNYLMPSGTEVFMIGKLVYESYLKFIPTSISLNKQQLLAPIGRRLRLGLFLSCFFGLGAICSFFSLWRLRSQSSSSSNC